MKAGEFCNREVVVIDKDASVADAAALMRDHHVGSVVVVDDSAGVREPVGILTDRDIVIEFVAKDVDPSEIMIGDAIAYELVTVDENAGLFETIEQMHRNGVRRMPVVDTAGALVGIFACDDALDLVTEQLGNLVALVARQQRLESQYRD